jgi:hypothetical protein
MVKVDDIQQKVLTTCPGNPSTMHCIGLPTYCDAVMIRLQAISSAVVKRLCILKTALSTTMSWDLR